MTKPTAVKFHLIDAGDGTIRIWRTSDPGDMFEVVEHHQQSWAMCETLAQQFPNNFTIGFPEEC